MKATNLFCMVALFTTLPFFAQELENISEKGSSSNRMLQNADWQELGPFDWNPTTSWNPGVGQVTCMAIDPSNSDIILAGTRSGVWKSTDGGQNWTPLNERMLNKEVKAVAIDPNNSNTYYFSTWWSLLYKSEDAGATWSSIDYFGFPVEQGYIDWINVILPHPTDSNILYVAKDGAEGLQFIPGLYRSLDGGENWELILESIDIYDVEFKPTDPNVIYVGGRNVYRSPDGGNSWAVVPGFSAQRNDLKMISVSEDDPERVYVLESESRQFGGFFVSTNSGLSFTELDHGTNNYFGDSTGANDDEGVYGDEMSIAVSENNADEVHIAGNISWISLDGGVTFTATSNINPVDAQSENIGYCHRGISELKFFNDELFVGTQGGIFKVENTTTVNSSYFTDLTTGMGIRYVTSLDVSQSVDPLIHISSWLNGSSFYTSAGGWKDWLGGYYSRGGLIDKDDDNLFYGFSWFNNELYRTEDGGNSIIPVLMPASGYFGTRTLQQDPVQSNTIYMAYKRVYKSTNKGESWSMISPEVDQSSLDILKVSPANNQYLFASGFSTIYRSTNGGASWVQGGMPQDTNQTIAIALHPTNPNILAFISTTFDRKSFVFVSTNGGASWENYTRNLPDYNFFSLAWDDNGQNGLYIGMENGVFYIDDTMDNWGIYHDNLPRIGVSSLKINQADGNIYAGTYGRGVWVSPKCDNCVLSVPDIALDELVTMYPNPAADEVTLKLKTPVAPEIQIFDLLGKNIGNWSILPVDAEITLDVSQLAQGTYFVKVMLEEGRVTKQLIKR